MRKREFCKLINKRVKDRGLKKCNIRIVSAVLDELSDAIIDAILEDPNGKVLIEEFVSICERDAYIKTMPGDNVVKPHKRLHVKVSKKFQNKFVAKWHERHPNGIEEVGEDDM